MSPSAVPDAAVARVLGTYAGLVHRVLSEPQRWLGLDEDPPPSAGFPVKVLDAIRDRALGPVTPASPQWSRQPRQRRVDWWLRRISVSAGLAAAAPRLAGALADRIPLQAALGASASGLAVCATAREYGVTEASAWVPLLSTVILGRDLPVQDAPVPSADAAENALTEESTDGPDTPKKTPAARRAASTVWRLARSLAELPSVLDDRPRGRRIFRLGAKLPVVGLAAGWLDERGGIRRASVRTARLLG